MKLAGTSLLPAIRKQKIQPRDLFFEHQTSCAILSDGWKLVRANGRQPWELIHLTTDPFETQDLSEQFPLKAKELENKWTRWAEQQHVYPFEYRPWTERINYYQSLYPDQKAKKTKSFHKNPCLNFHSYNYLHSKQQKTMIFNENLNRETMNTPAISSNFPLFPNLSKKISFRRID